MKRLIPLLLPLAATFMGPLAVAQNAACQSVEFSQSVLDRFPQIRKACLDIMDKGGQKFAVFKADLVRTNRDTAYVRVKLPDGTRSATRAIKFDSAFRVMAGGKSVPVSQLALGQEISAYIKVSEPVIALAPAVESEPLQLSPLEDAVVPAAAAAPAMPHTSSQLPLLLLAGTLLLLAAGALRKLRRSAP